MNIKQIPSPNFTVGRGGLTPEIIVVHISTSTLESCISWFQNPASQVSAHYIVGQDGSITQFVADENTAWANGILQNPTAEIILKNPNVNPNKISLSIENEGQDLANAPIQQMTTLCGLIASLAQKYNISCDRQHILGHFEIEAIDRKFCPSPNHSIMDSIVKQVVTLSTNTNNNMEYKWIKFFKTGVAEFQTLFLTGTDSGKPLLQDDGETSEFSTPEQAVAGSTTDVLIFWDGKEIGAGSQPVVSVQ